MIKKLTFSIVTMAVALVPGLSRALVFPDHPVKLIVPFSPGGGTDGIARVVATKLSQIWGQSVIVENKPGAGGVIGAEAVVRSKPDGYTLYVGNIGTQAINPYLYKKLPYDAEKAFMPISLITELPGVIIANPHFPASTVADLVKMLKAGKEPTYGSSGIGSTLHLAGAMLANMAGGTMRHVAYKGGGPAVADVISGTIDMAIPSIYESFGLLKSDRVKVLAVTGDKRSGVLPNVPTVAESGVPGYRSVSWIGLLAPAGTSQDIIDKIAGDVHAAVTDQKINTLLSSQGAVPVGSTPVEFRDVIEADKKRYSAVIKSQNITPN